MGGGEVTYRLARPDDVAAMADYHTRSWQVGYAGLLPEDALAALDVDERAAVLTQALDPALVAERGILVVVATVEAEGEARPVGHVLTQVRRGTDHGYLLHLYVDPDEWGRGIGRTLLEIGQRWLRRSGAVTAELWMFDGNDRAGGLYERSGWEATGETRSEEMFGVEVVEVQMTRTFSRDVLGANRAYWDQLAPMYDEGTSPAWSRDPSWGIFGHADADRHGRPIFPDVAGRDVVELGCGTAYVSGWAVARGARLVVGIDNSPQQLKSAQRNALANDAALGLIFGDAHRLPFADASFDVAINEYGAAIWCDPRVWIPEAARVLRPGGTLWFLGNSVVAMLCAPEFEGEPHMAEMRRPQRGMHRTEWIDTDNFEFHVSHGEMIDIITSAGLAVDALHELYSDADASSPYGEVTGAFASRWPVEEIWVARKPG